MSPPLGYGLLSQLGCTNRNLISAHSRGLLLRFHGSFLWCAVQQHMERLRQSIEPKSCAEASRIHSPALPSSRLRCKVFVPWIQQYLIDWYFSMLDKLSATLLTRFLAPSIRPCVAFPQLHVVQLTKRYFSSKEATLASCLPHHYLYREVGLEAPVCMLESFLGLGHRAKQSMDGRSLLHLLLCYRMLQ